MSVEQIRRTLSSSAAVTGNCEIGGVGHEQNNIGCHN